jgi:hypothetical protein
MKHGNGPNKTVQVENIGGPVSAPPYLKPNGKGPSPQRKRQYPPRSGGVKTLTYKL